MPALDIHSNEERHRFDLRDNTDQTRMFIKVKFLKLLSLIFLG